MVVWRRVCRLSSRQTLLLSINNSPRWQRYSSHGACLEYRQNGDPEKVVVKQEVNVSAACGDQVMG